MTKTARNAAVNAAMVVAVLAWTCTAAAKESGAAVVNQPSLTMPDARVRGVTTRIAVILTEAAAQSATFRGLVDRIGTTDGIVYVAEGACGQERLRACLLLTLTIAGSNRLLRILVDPRNSDRDLMGSIGHELQHAVEVLSDPSVRSDAAILLLYRERCQLCGGPCHRCGGRFETDAAVLAGDTVRRELKKSAAAGERRE